jgi:hypothetical protein
MVTARRGDLPLPFARVPAGVVLVFEAWWLAVVGAAELIFLLAGFLANDFSFDTAPKILGRPLYVSLAYVIVPAVLAVGLLISALYFFQDRPQMPRYRALYSAGLVVAILTHGAVLSYIASVALVGSIDLAALIVWSVFSGLMIYACGWALLAQIVPSRLATTE